MSVRSLLSLSLLTPYPAERSGGSPFGAEGREEDDRAERGPTRPRVRVTNGRKEWGKNPPKGGWKDYDNERMVVVMFLSSFPYGHNPFISLRPLII